jgi:hypothetical protein
MPDELAVIDRDHTAELFDTIIEAQRNPAFNPDLLERMYAFHRQVKADAAEDAYWSAMRECQLAMKPIQKKYFNTHTKSYYAKLHTVQGDTKPIYEKHGFGLSFTTESHADPRIVILVCTVSHKAGHRQRYQMEGAVDDKGPKGEGTKTSIQGTNSTATQLRKKLFELIFDLILFDDDNDGNRVPQSAQPISQDQADTLNSLLNNVGMETKEQRAQFLKWAGAARLSEIPAHLYDKAVSLLQDKAKKASK